MVARYLSALALILWYLALAVPAQAGPFTCSGDVYQVISGQLKIYDPVSSSYKNVGAPSGSLYNAAGFNTLDNYAYGMVGNSVVRIHADGTLQTVYTGLNLSSSNAGDVDNLGNLWIKKTSRSYLRIRLLDGTVAEFTITGDVLANAADIVFKLNGTVPYLVAVDQGNLGLIRLDTATNTGVGTVSPLSGLPSGNYGAAWVDSTGRMFAFHNNTGNFYELKNVFGMATATLAGTGVTTNNNDGFSCPYAPFPNLPPVAQDDAFPTYFQTAITGNLAADNGNGVDFDPEGFPPVYATSPVTGPSHGTVTISASGSMTYTPAAGFSGTDSFVYRITDVSGNSDTATVTITVAPPLRIVKVSTSYSDPINGTTNPKAIPGGFVSYVITVTNPASFPIDADTIRVADATPAALSLFVGNYSGASGGPVVFTGGSPASGLTYTYASLSSTSDDVEFSNDNGATWAYAPTASANGTDVAVTNIRVRPKGTMAANSEFSVTFRYMIK